MLIRKLVLQSICLVVMFYKVTNDDAHLKDCEKMSGCPNNPNYFNFERNIPRCYCDANCQAYEDCCKDFHDNMTDNYDYNPGDTSTCLTIEDDRVGFWIVNRCGKDGPICTDYRTLSNVLRHLPVTDSEGVHYFGDQCAMCNNVTHFRRWGVLVQEHERTDWRENKMASLGKVNKPFTKNSNTGISWKSSLDKINNIQTTAPSDLPFILKNLGQIRISVPSGVRLRVCYKFDGSDERDESNYPSYQNPVYVNYDLYKNPDWCGVVKNCSSRIIRCRQHGFGYVRGIDYKRSDELRSDEIRKLGVLFLFEDVKKACEVSSIKGSCTNRCQNTASECSKTTVKLWGYPLRKGRYLNLIWYESFDDRTEFMYGQAFYTFFLKSKWKIKLGSLTTFRSYQGSNCDGKRAFCNIMHYPFSPISSERLSAEDITQLESWTENLQFYITINIGKSIKMFGSFSYDMNKEMNCSCERNFYEESFKYNFEYPLLGFDWRTEYSECSEFNFDISLDKLDVRCLRGLSNRSPYMVKRRSIISFCMSINLLPLILMNIL